MYKKLMASHVRPCTPVPTSVKSYVNLKSPIRAILFDIYGTLFMSASGDIGSGQKKIMPDVRFTRLLKKYGMPFSAQQASDALFKAIESDHAAKRARGIDYPEIEIDRIWMAVLQFSDIKNARNFAVEYEMIANPVYPMPGLSQTLIALRKKSIPVGIISNAQFFTPHIFDLFCSGFPDAIGFDPDLIFYSYKYGFAKPSFFLFEKAAAALAEKGMTADQVLYVGNDMLNDISTAHAVGFQTCLFAGDQRSLRLRENDPTCETVSPDAVIKELNQLTDMIGST